MAICIWLFLASIVFAFAGLALLHRALSLRVALPLLLTALFCIVLHFGPVRQGIVFAPICLDLGWVDTAVRAWGASRTKGHVWNWDSGFTAGLE